MRTSTLVLAACVAAGTVAVAGFHLNSTASAAASATFDPGVETFILQATGNLPSCRIEKPRGEAAVVRVALAPECGEILPGLGQAHYWREKPDGTVELSADGVTPVATFEVGDGVAYESIAPRRPLMAMIQQN
jgi:hypothetical protein